MALVEATRLSRLPHQTLAQKSGLLFKKIRLLRKCWDLHGGRNVGFLRNCGRGGYRAARRPL